MGKSVGKNEFFLDRNCDATSCRGKAVAIITDNEKTEHCALCASHLVDFQNTILVEKKPEFTRKQKIGIAKLQILGHYMKNKDACLRTCLRDIDSPIDVIRDAHESLRLKRKLKDLQVD